MTVDPIVIAILGAVLSVFLAINAFFVRELVKSIQDVQVGVAGLKESTKSAHNRIDANYESIEMLRDRSHQTNNVLTGVSLKIALIEKDIEHMRPTKAITRRNENETF